MTSDEFNILFSALKSVVELQDAQSKSSANILELVESVMKHCMDTCDGKCGASHGG
tara:strand:- start:158 stop:325 length:168 start_codon:yes stop_codon:yes gene_type:complete